MKKALLLITTILLLQTIKAQSWCPSGATWYPGVFSGLSGYDAIVEYKYTHDTLIQNKNCKIIMGTFNGQNLPDFGTLNYTVVPNYRTYYTYESNNTVYLFQNNSFDTVVNFNAQIGDTWRALGCSGGNPYKAITITDTGHVTISNLSLKSITASYTIAITSGTTILTHTVNQTFTERILAPFVNWEDLFGRGCFHIPHTGDHNAWPQYCGYKDDAISTVFNNNSFCSKITSINETSIENKLGAVFPNPNSGNFTVSLKESSAISIYDALGSLVLQMDSDAPGNVEVKIPELPKGMYYLKTQGKSGSFYHKFLKE